MPPSVPARRAALDTLLTTKAELVLWAQPAPLPTVIHRGHLSSYLELAEAFLQEAGAHVGQGGVEAMRRALTSVEEEVGSGWVLVGMWFDLLLRVTHSRVSIGSACVVH